MKQKKTHKSKTIRICGRTYDLIFDPERSGGEFSTLGEDGKKRGYIAVGTKCTDPQHLLETLMHEIVEATLAVDNRRWRDEGNSRSTLIFSFDHVYLEEFCAKVIDSLISSGTLDLGEKECCS